MLDGADAGDWLQFFGALLAALIAVALWYLERRRTDRAETRLIASQKRDFRDVIKYAINDLAKQVNYVSNSFSSYIGDYENFQNIEPKVAAPAEADFNKIVRSRVEEMSLEIPKILEFSLEHARFLSPSENASLADVLSASRTLNARLWDVVSTASGLIPTFGAHVWQRR